jgi:hypothetical protein
MTPQEIIAEDKISIARKKKSLVVILGLAILFLQRKRRFISSLLF